MTRTTETPIPKKRIVVKKAGVAKAATPAAAKKGSAGRKAPIAKKALAVGKTGAKKASKSAAVVERDGPPAPGYEPIAGVLPAPFNPLEWHLAEAGPAGEVMPMTDGSPRKWVLYPNFAEAFRSSAMDGDAVDEFANTFEMSKWDVLFSLGFTNYRDVKTYGKRFENKPIERDRELLLRLYYASPGFPTLIKAPPVTELVRYLFNIQGQAGTAALKRCIPHLAILLGKDRVTGYRWARSKDKPADGPGASLSTQKVAAKVFSMQPDTARDLFWRIAVQVMRSRNMRMDRLRVVLADYNVRLPE